MMEEKIIPFNMGANAYIIPTDDGCILVDAGVKNKADVLVQKLKELGMTEKDIKLIVITHVHTDHVGSLKEIKDKSGAKIIIHKKDVEALKMGYAKLQEGTMIFTKIARFVSNNIFTSMNKFQPVTPDIVFNKEKYSLHEFGVDGEIIHTPGHTEGSVSLIINGEHAIVGDAMFNIRKNNIFPFFCYDSSQVLNSWKKLLAYNCKAYYPGHGKAITSDYLRQQLNAHEEMYR